MKRDIIDFLKDECKVNIDNNIYNNNNMSELDIIKYLIEECNMNGNIRGGIWHDTLLMIVCKYGELDICKYLINKYNMNVNITNVYGQTALMFPCERGHFNVIQYLIEECKANVNIMNNNGWTALMYTCEAGYLDIIKYLIDKCNVDVNIVGKYQHSALSHCLFPNKIDCIPYVTFHTNLTNIDMSDLFTKCWKDETKSVFLKALYDRNYERGFTFISLFTLGVMPNNNDESKYNEKSDMIGYDPPINANEVRPYPRMFDSNRKDALFDIMLFRVIEQYASDYNKEWEEF